MVARPFSLVGVEIRRRATSTARTSPPTTSGDAPSSAELAKGDFLPANPYYVGDVLHYYWMPHLLSAVEYRTWGDGVSLDSLLLTRSVLVDAIVRGRALRHRRGWWSEYAWAALAGVASRSSLATSVEGIVRAVGPVDAVACRSTLVRYLNIDAISRWVFGGMPIDGLQRVLCYQPHHAAGYAVGLLGLLARRAAGPATAIRRSSPSAGALLAAMHRSSARSPV